MKANLKYVLVLVGWVFGSLASFFEWCEELCFKGAGVKRWEVYTRWES